MPHSSKNVQTEIRESPRKSSTHRLRHIVNSHRSVVEPQPDSSDFTDGILKTVYINGPFGSASGQIFQAQHAVLICTGIGVTPFASVLQAIFHRYINQCFVCPNCETTCFQDPSDTFSIKKVCTCFIILIMIVQFFALQIWFLNVLWYRMSVKKNQYYATILINAIVKNSVLLFSCWKYNTT